MGLFLLAFAIAPQEPVEDPLPRGAILRLGSTRLRHAGIIAIAFSPDGKSLWTAGRSGVVRRWDASSGGKLREHTLGRTFVDAVAVSPDGKSIARAGAGRIQLHELERGAAIRGWNTPGVRTGHLSFSPDGASLVSTHADGTLRVWETATGRETVPTTAPAPFGDATYSPNGTWFAWVEKSGAVVVRDARTWTKERRLVYRSAKSTMTSLAFSPDGNVLATGCVNAALQLWDVEKGRILREFGKPSTTVYGVAISPDGRSVASGADGRIQVWDLSEGLLRWSSPRQGDGIFRLLYSPDGSRLVSVTSDDEVGLWDAATGRPLIVPSSHTGAVMSVAWSPDGSRIATGSQDDSVRTWDAASGAAVHRLEAVGAWGAPEWVNAVCFSPDGRWLAASSEGLHVWEADSGRIVRSKLSESVGESDVAWSPDGSLIADATNESIRLWDVSTFREKAVLNGHSDAQVRALAFSADGKALASAGDDLSIQLWDVTGARPQMRMEWHGLTMKSLAFAPDGSLLASAGEQLMLWDAVAGRPLTVLGEEAASDVAFSSDGRLLVSAGRTSIQVWEIATLHEVAAFPMGGDPPHAVAFSPDGRQLVSGHYSGAVLIWSVFAPARGDREAHWKDLASANGARAHVAIGALAAGGPAAAAFVEERIARPPADPAKMKALIERLENDDVEARNQVSQELESVADEPSIRKAIEAGVSSEVKARLEGVVKSLGARVNIRDAETRRRIRAAVVLELLEAREALGRVATSAPFEIERREARAAVARLSGFRGPDVKMAPAREGPPTDVAKIRAMLPAHLVEAMPGVEERLAKGGAEAWVEVFLEAEMAVYGDKPTPLAEADLDSMAGYVLRIAPPGNGKMFLCGEIANMQLKGAIPALVEALEDDSDEVQGTAASALAAMGAREGIPGMRRLLRFGSLRSRLFVAIALGKLRAEEAEEDLKAALERSRHEKEREALRYALEQIRK